MSHKQTTLSDLRTEMTNTRRLLERVPDDKFDWKPHDKSMSLGELSTHVAHLLEWPLMTIQQDSYDLAADFERPVIPASRDVLLEQYDGYVEALTKALEEASEETLNEPWALKNGDYVIFSMPKAMVIRNFGINHTIHHRGQLTVYLRLLGVPLPPIYGPTADENPMA